MPAGAYKLLNDTLSNTGQRGGSSGGYKGNLG